jgi:hypothetical protein
MKFLNRLAIQIVVNIVDAFIGKVAMKYFNVPRDSRPKRTFGASHLLSEIGVSSENVLQACKELNDREIRRKFN